MPESDPNSFGMKLMNFFTDFLGGAATKDPSYGAKRRRVQEDADRQKLEDAYRERQRKRLETPASFITSGMETEGTPPVTGVPYQGGETPSYEVPQTPVATRQGIPQVDWRNLTLQDIPTAVSLSKEFRGEEPEVGVTREGAPYYKKGPKAGQSAGPALGQPKTKEDKAHGQPWQDAEGNMWQTFTSGAVKPVQTEAPAYPSGTPTLEDIPGQYFRPTKEMAEGKKLEQIKGKKPDGKGLQHVEENRGDAYRKGTYNPDTGEYKWENWTSKRPAPERPSKEEKGLTKGKIQTMYAAYVVGRLKEKFDPTRVLMEEDFKKEGIPVPDRMPELSPDEFETYVTKGTLPEKKGLKGKQLDEATARKFLEKAGGDKEKARKLAKDEGYTF